MPLVGCGGFTIDADLQRDEAIAVEPQGPIMVAVARDYQGRADAGASGIEVEIQRNIRHQPIRRAIIRATNDGGRNGGSVHVGHSPKLGRRPGKDQRRHPLFRTVSA